jgi:glycosyltransferase involved in cell wall biosynthesis
MYPTNYRNKEKLVTVFMPVYNKELYIACALDSVLAQEVNFGYEIFIIDDCSTDNSTKIIQEYIGKYPDKIKFIQNEKNLKLLATATKGYELIKTKYWTVLDPDDYWLGTTKMQSAINYLEAHPAFTGYATNTYLDDGKKEKLPMFGDKNMDYDFYTCGIYIAHTSGSFFRNVFTQEEIDTIKEYLNTKFESSFRGDSFRNFYHLRKGKIHFENKLESVYRMLESGIYGGLTNLGRNFLNLKFFYIMFIYFQQENTNMFLNTSWFYINKIFFVGYKTLKLLTDVDKDSINDISKIVEKVIKYKNEFGLLFDPSVSKNFCFYLPSHDVCEYAELFVALSKYLSEQLGFDVYYIDYKDGFAIRQLKNSEVKFIYYTDGMEVVEQNIPFNIILPATLAFQVPRLKNALSKVVFLFEHYKFENLAKMQVVVDENQSKLFLLLKCFVWIFEVIKRF